MDFMQITTASGFYRMHGIDLLAEAEILKLESQYLGIEI
jgi:hypothetical protein